jgi:hypothetical protein
MAAVTLHPVWNTPRAAFQGLRRLGMVLASSFAGHARNLLHVPNQFVQSVRI